ncbi:formyltransferase family protein [Arcobacter sp. F2176]|uniref:formyltransferase family protein n=1 Tax=Arcobacter sp. F2176 TaxID=2044511 RepID=UPI00100A3E52|nr:formyltransferase family protein [Arcobacter sp. F2176]RXJ82212.1 hypothetical protein CRU95_01780 [Arcobacter sp. F2176]
MKIVFIVGKRGGDYFAVKRAIEKGLLQNIEIVYIISNSSLSKAMNDYKIISDNFYCKQDNESRVQFFDNVQDLLAKIEYDYIVLSGFDWLIPSKLVETNINKIINSHHSLLPAHPGLFKKEKLVESDDKFLGATLHFVDNGVDTGIKLTQAVFLNYGIEKFDLILKIYRFIQDCMIVQSLAELNNQEAEHREIYFNEILFNPSIERNILKCFERIYFGK